MRGQIILFGALVLAGGCGVTTASAQDVRVFLDASVASGDVVLPGQILTWTIGADASASGADGIALFSADLVSSSLNGTPIELTTGTRGGAIGAV